MNQRTNGPVNAQLRPEIYTCTNKLVSRAVTIFQKCIAIYYDIWEVYCNNTTIYCPNKKGAFLSDTRKNWIKK